MNEVIDYDRLVDGFRRSLVDNLRGSGMKAGVLESWVPEEDVTKGMRSLLQTLALAGEREACIRLGSRSAAALDLGELADIARIDAQPEADGLLVTVRGLASESAVVASGRMQDLAARNAARRRSELAGGRPALAPIALTQPQDIGPVYRPVLAAVAAPWPHAAAASADMAQATIDGLTLAASVDAAHTIRRLSFSGARNDVAGALAEVLCQVSEGLPILEAADHGAIRLEAALHGEQPRPVAGVPHPAAADAAFLLPQALLRALLQDYRRRTGYAETQNDYNPSPSPRWLEMSFDQRRAVLLPVIAQAATELDVDPTTIEVVAVEWDVRVVLALPATMSGGDKQHFLMRAERAVHLGVDPRLELFQEELKDKNKLRRLK